MENIDKVHFNDMETNQTKQNDKKDKANFSTEK